jgi:hypothetical protein
MEQVIDQVLPEMCAGCEKCEDCDAEMAEMIRALMDAPRGPGE